MEYDVTLTELSPQSAVVVHGEVPMGSIGPFIGKALEKVMTTLTQAGAFPVGPPFARYDMHDGMFIVDAGFPCDARSIDGDGVQPMVLPAGLAATTLHRGGYDKVSAAYTALERWMRDNGYEPAGAPWETYLDGPEVSEPRTVITWPCEGRG